MTAFVLRIGKLLLELLALALAGLTLMGIFLFWRISQGPITIGFLAPHVTEALQGMLPPGMGVSMDDVFLAWDSRTDNLDFRASGIRLMEKDHKQVAGISQLGFSVSLRRLVFGDVRLTGITLYQPQIHILRQADGALSLAFGAEGPSAESSAAQGGNALLAALLQPPDAPGTGPLSTIRRFSITDAGIVVDDRVLGFSWQVPQASLVMSRSPDMLGAVGDFDAVLGEQVVRFHADLAHRYGSPDTIISAKFSGADPTLIAPLSPKLAALSNLDIPLSGETVITLDPRLMPSHADIALSGENGRISLPGLYSAPLDVHLLTLRAGIDVPARRIDLQEFAADLGGPIARATGVVMPEGDSWRALIETAAANVPLDSLGTFWPESLSADARAWVTESLSRGTVSSASASLSLTAPQSDPETISLDGLSGHLAFSGITVDYLPPMPPVYDVSGVASFDADNFNLSVSGGRMKDIAVGKTSIPIGGLSTSTEHITLDIPLDGSLSAIIGAIDGEPLDLAKNLGLSPSQVSGRATGILHLAFPLTNHILVSDITVAAKARLRDVVMNGLIGKWPITEGDFLLDLTGKGMNLNGVARIGGTPAVGKWEESFVAEAAPTRVTFQATLSDGDRRRMGLDFIPRLSGNLQLDGTYTQSGSGNGTLSGALNLADAAILAPEIGLVKKAGADGTASFVANLKGGVLERVGSINLNTDSIDATGEARFDKNGAVSSIDLSSIAFGKNQLGARLQPLEKQGWAIDIKGPVLDLSPFLDDDDGGIAAAGTASPMPFQVSLDVDEAQGKDGKLLDHLKGKLDILGTRVTSADAAGTLGKGKISISFRPDEGARHRLRIEMSEAGAFLKASDILGTVRGGKLVLDGKTEPRPSPFSPFVVTGALEMKDFVLVDAPALARILNALSLPGFLELLGSEGFRFSQLYADFTFSKNRIDIREGRAAGASLGITFAGNVDRAKDTLDVGGIVIPVHGLNSVLQAIPLLGNILTGGEGGGLIAATYRISGPTKDTQASVNPLSILMPGFLRSLFFPAEGSRLLPNTPPRK